MTGNPKVKMFSAWIDVLFIKSRSFPRYEAYPVLCVERIKPAGRWMLSKLLRDTEDLRKPTQTLGEEAEQN